MSDTPYTDLHEAHWEDFAGSNLMVVEADRCRQLERDRAILLLAVRAALEDDKIDVSSMTDEALVAKITEALGDSQ